MNYKVRLCAYSGITFVLYDGDEKREARNAVAWAIRYHRNILEYPITSLKRGREWELESDPEGERMVGDHEGILVIDEIPTCDECGKILADGDEGVCEDCSDREDIDRCLRCLYCGESLDDFDAELCDDCREEHDLNEANYEEESENE